MPRQGGRGGDAGAGVRGRGGHGGKAAVGLPRWVQGGCAVVERIDNVGIAVRDLAAAEAFYARLGFHVESRDDSPGALMAAGEARLYLFETNRPEGGVRRSPDLAGNPPGIDHISFWVGDVDEAYRRLKAQGVPFATEPADQDWGARACSLHDPDGNVIFLLGPLSGR